MARDCGENRGAGPVNIVGGVWSDVSMVWCELGGV